MYIWHTQEISILSLVEIAYVLRQNLKFFSMTPWHSHQQQDTILFPVAWTTQLQAEGADSVNNKETDIFLAADNLEKHDPNFGITKILRGQRRSLKKNKFQPQFFFNNTVKEQKMLKTPKHRDA